MNLNFFYINFTDSLILKDYNQSLFMLITGFIFVIEILAWQYDLFFSSPLQYFMNEANNNCFYLKAGSGFSITWCSNCYQLFGFSVILKTEIKFFCVFLCFSVLVASFQCQSRHNMSSTSNNELPFISQKAYSENTENLCKIPWDLLYLKNHHKLIFLTALH